MSYDPKISMNEQDIRNYRLANQQIVDTRFRKPEELVAFLGAMQAQSYQDALWAIGLRLKAATKADVEEAIYQRTIVRTWPMRHTLHFVSPKDVRWMLSFYRNEPIPKYQRSNGLDRSILEKGEKIIASAFKEKAQLTSREIYQKLAGSNIPALKKHEIQAHILRRAGRDGIVCFGSHIGKQPTFALLDNWVSKSKPIKKEEALAELAKRYFRSHGPATLKDFVWWSGLSLSDARLGIHGALPELSEETFKKSS